MRNGLADDSASGHSAGNNMRELQGLYLEDLEIGMTAIYSKTVTDADVVLFAGITGDSNPLHMDSEFAKETLFKGRIAHGMLTASFISTVLGTKLPGPGCIYVSQNLKFRAPVRIGDTVRSRVTQTEIDKEKGRATFETNCTVGNVAVITGEAILMVQRRLVPQAAE
jgi:3-hydroxybutyryl-CoA dehydratase